MQIKVNCVKCDSEFLVYPYRLKEKKEFYCSRKCYWKNKKGSTVEKRKNGNLVNCAFCDFKFYLPMSRIKRSKNTHCSLECYKKNKQGILPTWLTPFKEGHNLGVRIKPGNTPWNKGIKTGIIPPNKKFTKKQALIAQRVRNRFKQAIKKQSSAVCGEIIGIDYPGYIEYLEALFIDGMSWENTGDWHIDHILPISSFNMSDPEEIKKAFHYKNTQPLWAKENLSKGSKLLSQPVR